MDEAPPAAEPGAPDVEQLELQQQALEDALQRNKQKLKEAKLKRKAELEDSARKAHEVAHNGGDDGGPQCSVCFAPTDPDKRISAAETGVY